MSAADTSHARVRPWTTRSSIVFTHGQNSPIKLLLQKAISLDHKLTPSREVHY